eukprot:749056-Hanusia_phi.AAC.4
MHLKKRTKKRKKERKKERKKRNRKQACSKPAGDRGRGAGGGGGTGAVAVAGAGEVVVVVERVAAGLISDSCSCCTTDGEEERGARRAGGWRVEEGMENASATLKLDKPVRP